MNKLQRGIFLVIDGIDGAGKTTQIRHLTEKLEAKGIKFHITHEPGGTDLGEKIRSLLLDPKKSINPYAELLLIFAARAQHVHEVIAPKIESGEWVICSRFTDATRAYQGFGRHIPMRVIDDLAEIIHPTTCPDLSFFIDLPVSDSNKRLETREQLDRFEKSGNTFMEEVRKGYLEIAESSSGLICLDGTKTVSEISEMIWQEINTLYPDAFA